MKFVDAITIPGTRKRGDGSLLVDARVARTGIQLYSGAELGKPDKPVIRVLRDDAEVFDRVTMASFAHRPVTNDHPKDLVTADNWKAVAVGNTADEVTKDEIYLRVPLMVSDGPTIADIEGGKRELSSGYTCDVDFTAGNHEKYGAFDAQMRNIRANHVAIVKRGRAGAQVRIGDGDDQPWGISPIGGTIEDEKPMSAALRNMIVDGIPVEVSDLAASVIDKLTGQIRTLTDAAAKATTDHVAAITAKDTEIGRLTAELKTAKDALPTPATLATLVRDRANLVTLAAKAVPGLTIADADTDADIRRKVVTAKLGDALAKDRTDAEISGMFLVATKDMQTAPTPNDPFRQAMTPTPGAVPVGDVRLNAYSQYVNGLVNAHQAPAPAVAGVN